VALNLVGKLRELAADGDAGAVAEVKALDGAITRGDVKWLQQFENDLLDKCRDCFELINGRDHLVLSRLKHDRNSCAHPAFVAPDQVFTPTAELARSHLVAAVDTVLEQAALGQYGTDDGAVGSGPVQRQDPGSQPFVHKAPQSQ